nr:SET and MYND domain-containing protein 4-like isoform X2 [Ciona intestinalis]|eukprot:XP_018667825.1 SET and MYND domain-containing protein 4-like isoform X2 [Ciona intestinalis]
MIVTLYSNRSACWFHLKKYEYCVCDIQRAFFHGGCNTNIYSKLVSRLVWSYWYIGDFSKCESTLTKWKDGIGHELQDKLKKVNRNKETKFEWREYIVRRKEKKKGSNLNNENKSVRNLSAKVKMNITPQKGRHYFTTFNTETNECLLEEVAYLGVLNPEFFSTHCSYCLTPCKSSGIPCLGCSCTIYCDEQCRISAWKIYHWMECSVIPMLAIKCMELRVAVRALLTGAYELGETPQHDTTHTCTSIAKHIYQSRNSCADCSEPVGTDPKDGVYKCDYWSIFCLKTSSCVEKNSDFKNDCSWFCMLVSTIRSEVFGEEENRAKDDVASLKELLQEIFNSLNLKYLCENPNFDMDFFRNRIKTISEMKSLSKMSNVMTKIEPGQLTSMGEVIEYLLHRHYLQVPINGQSISFVTEELCDNVTVTRRDIVASAFFPTMSMMNHSCDCNTDALFNGSTVTFRSNQFIPVGAEITHCYGPSVFHASFEERQKTLKENYSFDCDCTPCAMHKSGNTDKEALHTQLRAMKCKHCCGPVELINKESSVLGKCIDMACQKTEDYTKEKDTCIMLKKRMDRTLLQESKGEITIKAAVKKLEEISTLLENVVYKNNFTRAKVWDKLSFLLCKIQDYAKAVSILEQSIKLVALKFGPKSVHTARQIFSLTSIHFMLSNYSQAAFYLRKCEPIFSRFCTPGSKDYEDMVNLKQCLKTLKVY